MKKLLLGLFLAPALAHADISQYLGYLAWGNKSAKAQIVSVFQKQAREITKKPGNECLYVKFDTHDSGGFLAVLREVDYINVQFISKKSKAVLANYEVYYVNESNFDQSIYNMQDAVPDNICEEYNVK